MLTLIFQYRQSQNWWEQLIESVIESPIFWAVILIPILYFILRETEKEHHSHWNQLIEDFSYSSKDFYKAFKKDVLSHGISGIETSYVQLHEGNAFTRRRLYVRVRWKDLQYDICAAPFGDGFFISWWLIYPTSLMKELIVRIPFVGKWLLKKIYPVTFYKIDTASMFMTYCQSSVLNVIEEITKDSSARALTEAESKPMLNDFFKR